MYSDLVTNIDATSGVWYDLLNGADFTDKLNRANHWQGFKTVGLNAIANYIYYNYKDENLSITTNNGETMPAFENMTLVPSESKMRCAWNEMVEWLWIMDDYIRQNQDSYPDYIGLTYPPFNINDYVIGCEPSESSNNEFFQLKSWFI